MRFLAILLTCLVFAVLQSQLGAGEGVLVRPDFVLLTVLLWGLALGLQAGMLAAVVGGLMLDSVSAGPLGMHVLALMAATLLTPLREREVVASRFLLALVLAPLGTAVYYGVVLAVLQVTGHPVDWGGQTAVRIVPAATVNTVVIAPLYVVIALIAARLGMPYSGTVVRRPR